MEHEETVSEVLAEIDRQRRLKPTPAAWTIKELDEIILRLNSAEHRGIDRATLDRVEGQAKWLRATYAAKVSKYMKVPLWNVMIRLGSKRGPMVEKQESFL